MQVEERRATFALRTSSITHLPLRARAAEGVNRITFSIIKWTEPQAAWEMNAAKHPPDLLERPASLLVPTWGGAEHKVPVVISKIFKDQVADQTGMLFIGDAVLQVNGINVEKCTHEEVVHLLRTAGDEVTITVRYLREAPAFLKLPLGSPGPSSDQSSRASSPLFDSGLHLNGNSSNTAPSSPCSPSDNEPKYEKRWLDAVNLPLFMARISRRKAGSDKLRVMQFHERSAMRLRREERGSPTNAFNFSRLPVKSRIFSLFRDIQSSSFDVIALDGVCTHILQFCTAAESADWLQAISTNINHLTHESIVHMGWVCEHLQTSDVESVHRCRFMALRAGSLLIFRRPTVTASDWTEAEARFHLCEVLFKFHKLWIAEDCWIHTQKFSSGELRDSEPFCFSVHVGHGQSLCFSVELGSDLVFWEKAFQRAMFTEVQRVQELEFSNLTAVLHCIHAFIAAKVATVDPVFINSQSISQKYINNS
ncbi:Gamma-2-syntrophin [Triplophysa tibetana]|uniref:Gamma-2-syntrophin n=1 Tax=Triplophysa tibetana TaxID=1572043 RepID=A0A5A9NRR6_9TELE|nr:Gamma-2-syntrophin [Triplophysa tibetana]